MFLIDKAVAGFAEVRGEPFISKKQVWDNGIFPYRITIKFIHVMLPDNRPPVLGEIRDALTDEWTPRYGWGILNQRLITGVNAKKIVRVIQRQQNDLAEIKANLEHYLEETKLKRDEAAKPKRVRLPKKEVSLKEKDEALISKSEESVHSKFQNSLVRLGKSTGCTVWIASNDRNRVYEGKKLGEGCLKKLPKMGLSEEATKKISLIDVIWIRQNAPVCAFEVEVTSSIYSGLLRMSDLLTVVPALKIKLFIVAPKVRQNRVMGELNRPTFQKIGLSEYCKFIPAEELEPLLKRVEDLKGHINRSVIDTVAVDFSEELEGALE